MENKGCYWCKHSELNPDRKEPCLECMKLGVTGKGVFSLFESKPKEPPKQDTREENKEMSEISEIRAIQGEYDKTLVKITDNGNGYIGKLNCKNEKQAKSIANRINQYPIIFGQLERLVRDIKSGQKGINADAEKVVKGMKEETYSRGDRINFPAWDWDTLDEILKRLESYLRI